MGRPSQTYLYLWSSSREGSNGPSRATGQAPHDCFRQRDRTGRECYPRPVERAESQYIAPGRPMQNSYVESSNGRICDELVDDGLFFGLDRAAAPLRSGPTIVTTSDRTHRSDTRRRRTMTGSSSHPAPTLHNGSSAFPPVSLAPPFD